MLKAPHSLARWMANETAGVIETIHITQTAAKTSNGETSRASQTTRREEKRWTKEGKATKVPKRGKDFPFLTKCRDLGNSQYYMCTNVQTHKHIPITHSCETKKDSSHMCRYGAAGKKILFIFQHVLFVFTIGMLTSAWVFRLILMLSIFTFLLGRSLLLPSSVSLCARVCVSYIVRSF